MVNNTLADLSSMLASVREGGKMLIKDLAQIDAENVRREYWDGIFPVDPIVIVRRMGVTPYLSCLGDTSGLIVRPANEQAKIYVNRFESKARQRFTYAHEIGHYVERTRNRDDAYTFRDRRAGKSDTPHEWYADHFAANLLMPQAVFEELVEVYGATCDELVGYFGVSISAVRTRARSLGLGDDI
jgi:hypothetical protein